MKSTSTLKVRRRISGHWFEVNCEYNPDALRWDDDYKGWAQRKLNDRLDRIEQCYRQLETVISNYQWNKPRQCGRQL